MPRYQENLLFTTVNPLPGVETDGYMSTGLQLCHAMLTEFLAKRLTSFHCFLHVTPRPLKAEFRANTNVQGCILSQLQTAPVIAPRYREPCVNKKAHTQQIL